MLVKLCYLVLGLHSAGLLVFYVGGLLLVGNGVCLFPMKKTMHVTCTSPNMQWEITLSETSSFSPIVTAPSGSPVIDLCIFSVL